MKISLAITFLSLFLTSVSFSQDSRWLIGPTGSVDYSYRILTVNTSYEYGPLIADARDRAEQARLGWSAGVQVAYKIKPCLKVISGLQFSRQGYKYRMEDLVYGDLEDPRQGFIYETQDSEIPQAVMIRQSFNFLEIPAKVSWCLGKGKVRPQINGGMIIGILGYQSRTVVKEYSDHVERDRHAGSLGLHAVQYSATSGAGVIASISERLSASAEIAGIIPLNDLYDTSISERLWRVGLNMGCLFRI